MPEDYGDWYTELRLARLERRIKTVYAKAEKDVREDVKAYFERFAQRDEQQKKLLDAGEITKKEYKLWRMAQIGRGERLEALANRLAQRYTDANEEAAAYMNDDTPSIYAVNRNQIAYEIEVQAGEDVFHPDEMRTALGVDFILWDEATVQRLIKDDPDLMPFYPPKRAIDRGIDLEWGRKQINSTILSSILRGSSLKKIADELQERIKTMNRNSALRAARTAMTTAQNAGRQDGFIAAETLGIKVNKRWIATKDFRTRHDHGAADGQIVPAEKPFIVGGYEMMFPGDQSFGAPGSQIYNCRCRMRTVEKPGIEAEPRMMRVRGADGRNILVKEMTYTEWEAWVNERGG